MIVKVKQIIVKESGAAQASVIVRALSSIVAGLSIGLPAPLVTAPWRDDRLSLKSIPAIPTYTTPPAGSQLFSAKAK